MENCVSDRPITFSGFNFRVNSRVRVTGYSEANSLFATSHLENNLELIVNPPNHHKYKSPSRDSYNA